MAVTGHKNQQSLTDYDELDDKDHLRPSKILSSETTSKQLAKVPLPVHMPPMFNPLQPLNPPVATPNNVIMHPSAPVFNIQNSSYLQLFLFLSLTAVSAKSPKP